MEKIRLGSTNLNVSRSGFGCLPIQRIGFTEARELLEKAYENGITFYDTARSYTDSEAKIGEALSGVRSKIVIATKSKATDKKGVLEDLEQSLKHLNTNYVDLFQLHNPNSLPDPGDPDSSYQALLEAKKAGLTRSIGITCHKLPNAIEAVKSGLYNSLQYPLSSISTDRELAIIDLCRSYGVGLIAMKALAGGFVNSVAAIFAFLRQYDNIVTIWGINEEWQLEEFISLERDPPTMDSELFAQIEKDRVDLNGAFCRGCGYCMPCPVDIPIQSAARISFFLKNAPYERFINQEYKEKIERINDCIKCNRCKDNCPYELNIPELLKEKLEEYRSVYKQIKGCY